MSFDINYNTLKKEKKRIKKLERKKIEIIKKGKEEIIERKARGKKMRKKGKEKQETKKIKRKKWKKIVGLFASPFPCSANFILSSRTKAFSAAKAAFISSCKH